MARNVPQFIDVPRGPRKKPPVQEVPVPPVVENRPPSETIEVGGVWVNATGDKIYIEAPTMIDVTPVDPAAARGMQAFGSVAEVQEFLAKNNYTFRHIRGAVKEDNQAEHSYKGGESDETKAELDKKISELLERVDSDRDKINSVIEEANKFSTQEEFEAFKGILDDISTKTEGILWKVNKISLDDDKLDESESQMDEILGEKRKNRDALNEITEALAELLKTAEVTLESLKTLAVSSSDTTGENTTPPADSAAESTKETPEKRGNGSSSGDGGDGGDTAWRKELDAFLERPEGREIIDTYKMIVTGEWRYFSDAIWKSKKYISFHDRLDLWEKDERLLPDILKRLASDLTAKRGVTAEQAESILGVVLHELHVEYLAKQEEKRK